VPLEIAVHVEAEKAFGAENRDDALAIGGRGGIAMGSLGVALDARDGFIAEFIPQNFSIAFIEAEQAPLVRLFFLVGCTIAVDADFEV